MRVFFYTVILSGLLIAASMSAFAQNGDLKNMRFSRIMVPVDAVTLKSEGVEIRLWGIKPASTSEAHLELRAIDVMQKLINDNEVNCRIMSAKSVTRPTARCATAGNEDLSLVLLQRGLAIRDRRALYGSVFASSYQEAEELARRNGAGIWAFVKNENSGFIKDILNDPKKLTALAIGLVLLPVFAMLLMGLFVRQSVNKLLHFQTQDANNRLNKEKSLHRREKSLILDRIVTELEENKSRVEAFLTVYMEMLSNIKDMSDQPKYQQSGDVVALQPNFSRDVFDENLNKLSTLDMRLASELGKFYKEMGGDPEYIDLSSSTPREEAITVVDNIVSNAREHLPLIDRAIAFVRARQAGETAA